MVVVAALVAAVVVSVVIAVALAAVVVRAVDEVCIALSRRCRRGLFELEN